MRSALFVICAAYSGSFLPTGPDRLSRNVGYKLPLHVILIALTLQQWLCERAIVLRYMYSTCLVMNLKRRRVEGGRLHEKRNISAFPWRQRNANRMYLDGLEDWKETVLKYFSFHCFQNSEKPLFCLRIPMLRPLFLWCGENECATLEEWYWQGKSYLNTEMLLRPYIHIRLQFLPHTQAPPQLLRPVNCRCWEAYKTRT